MTAHVKSARQRARIIAGAIGLSMLAYGQVALFAFQSQGGFVKVPDDQLGRQETLPAAPLVMTAYAFVWTAIFVYVFMLWRRIGKVERDLADLTRAQQARPAGRG